MTGPAAEDVDELAPGLAPKDPGTRLPRLREGHRDVHVDELVRELVGDHAADLAGGDLPVVAVVALEGDRLGLGRDDATWRRMFSGGLKWSYRLITLITSCFTVFYV